MARGSIKQDKNNGTWYFTVDVPGENGERRQVKRRGFPRKKEAQIALTELLREVDSGDFIQKSKNTLAEVFEEWLESKTGNMGRLTIDSYKSYIARHINPVIGNVKMCDLTPDHVQKLVTALRKKTQDDGKAPLLTDSTIQRIFNILVTVLNYAIRKKYVRENVAHGVDKPKIQKRKLRVWSVQDCQTFLTAIYDHRYYICFHLALATGMRQGELLGLTWENVDLDNKLIRITQTLEHDGKAIKQGAKSSSGVRSISISDQDVEELKRQQRRIEEEKDAAGDTYQDQGFVVSSKFGRITYADPITKMFRRESDRLGLPKLRFHDLRHTHASLLLKQGVHPKIVSERLGHSSITITLDTYSHLLPNMQEEAARDLGTLLFA